MTEHRTQHWLGAFLVRFLLGLLVVVGFLVIALGTLLLAHEKHYASRIHAGISIQGVPVGGLTTAEALERTQTELATAGLPYISLQTTERTWTVSGADLGGRMGLEAAVWEAWRLGRAGDFRADLQTQARLLWWGYDIVPQVRVESGPSLAYLRRIERVAASPARRAQLWVAGLQARADESSTGREMDIEATRTAVEDRLREALGNSAWGERSLVERINLGRAVRAESSLTETLPVDVVFRQVTPPINEVAGASERVAALLSGPVTLTFTGQEVQADGALTTVPHRWTIDPAVIESWLTMRSEETEEGLAATVDVDSAKIDAYLLQLAQQIDRPARNARYSYDVDTHALTTAVPGQTGYALDREAARLQIAQACFSTERAVELPVQVTPPGVSRQDLEALLPLELVGQGESSFVGSTAERLQNIEVATAHFQGVVVPAGATFSFVEHLGLVTLSGGYSEAWVIMGNRTVLGAGGGVCQVSTTAFRAAFWSGFPIAERTPHSYRVGWYEPPVGLDAAVFSPSVDMKFVNDSATPILILTEVDKETSTLRFSFYGKSDGRVVAMSDPETSNPVPAGPAVEELDETLAPGQRVRVESAHDGVDVRIVRTVKRGDEILSQDTFFSRYVPWAARYRIGPSGQ
ncbi:MAG: VanW family protein [Anaerolineae bacterium]